MWIDIKEFMIISIDQFNDIIDYYGLNITIFDENYFITYLMTNIFAYFVIIVFVWLLYRFVHKLMPRDWRKYR